MTVETDKTEAETIPVTQVALNRNAFVWCHVCLETHDTLEWLWTI